jgi:uncharacterized membrane protein
MAGIGFELRKAIHQESTKGKFSGYIGAAFSSSGSMLVGIILFSLIQLGAKLEKVTQTVIDQFMCYVTNTMFFSMIVVAAFSLILSRYVSNKMYENQYEKVMPSFIGATTIISALGGTLFTGMMIISNVSLSDMFALLFLYLVLSCCWLLMSYITLIRKYKSVVVAYIIAFIISILLLIVLCAITQLSLLQMIFVLALCFSIVDILLFRAIYRAFPAQDGSIFEFIKEYKTSPALGFLGVFMMLGMLGHFWITWFSSSDSVTILGLFKYGPHYDFPAIIAFFSTIPASIYFITIFETDFSEKYQKYFYFLGHGGSVEKVNSAREDMIDSIRSGIRKLTRIQIVSCLLFITVGAKLLAVMNIGMTESMLDTFRMFCIGYSLYYIANTLVLVHLYFVNEKRMQWSSALFALLTISSAYFSAKYFPNTYGVGFVLSCVLLVVVAAYKLIKHLENLEFNVFTNETTIKMENIKSRQNKPINKKHIKYAITAGVLCLTIMFSSLGIIIKNNIEAANILEFVPAKSNAVLTSSPGMGLAPWADSEETLNLDTTLVYVELKWSDWEPVEGYYDVDFVNENFNLDYYRKDNRKVVFRFICDEPGEEEHIDIPEWLFHMIDGDGTMYNIDYGMGFSPNYNNLIFIEKHAEAIAALGEYFGKDDFFIYVELGSLGHWGEWHVNYEKGITPIPEYAVREEYIQPYIKSFPNAQFLLRYPLIDVTNNGFGLYNDMTGDYDETVYWIEQMNGGIWEQTGLEEQSNCLEVWKTKPIGGEFASTYEDSHFMITDFDLTLEGIIDSHQSFIGPKIIIDESDENYQKSMNEILKKIGYRYYVEKVAIDMNPKNSLTITCTMGNDGIAPIYQNYEVELSIIDGDGNEVWVSENTDFDLRKLLPGNNQSFSCDVAREELDDDTMYKLVISIKDSANNAVVPMALEAQTETNHYQIAEFKIK